MIPTQKENPKGLHQRYFVAKWIQGIDRTNLSLEDSVIENDEAEYFVLRLDEKGGDREHIKACRIAAHAYAEAIKHHLPELSNDIKNRYPII